MPITSRLKAFLKITEPMQQISRKGIGKKHLKPLTY